MVLAARIGSCRYLTRHMSVQYKDLIKFGHSRLVNFVVTSTNVYRLDPIHLRNPCLRQCFMIRLCCVNRVGFGHLVSHEVSPPSSFPFSS